MRPRSLRKQLVLGAVVAVLWIAAGAVIGLAGWGALQAIRDGDGTRAIERGLIALLSPIVPVIALAAYGHWLQVTERRHAPREEHIPTAVEDWGLGIAVALVVLAGYPVGSFAYTESVAAFEERQLAFMVGYGVLGVVYVAFAAFCISRYVNWLR